MTETARPAKIPRLAGDATRAWIAVGITFPVSLVGGFVAGLAIGLFDLRYDRDVFQWVLTLGSFVFFFLIYELFTVITFRKVAAPVLRRWAKVTKPRRRAAFVSWVLSGGGATTWSSTAALMSLGVVVVVAFSSELRSHPGVLATGALLVITSWLMIPVTYAVQYLREYAERGGLEFPGDTDPEFADFLYLSLQISTTFSSSDVALTSRAMRRRVTAQSLLAFVFNSVIVALLVSALLITAPG